jgi:hypothetical protein
MIGRRLTRFIRQRLLGGAHTATLHNNDVWSIGIYAGDSPFDLAPVKRAANPVLTHRHVTDIPARFVADPFMLKVGQTWYMFFEVMNRRTTRGEIGLATSADGLEWKYRQIVLVEPFHLSYPCVFEWAGNYYMIPETHKASAVRLYQASKFPTDWSLAATLISGHMFSDASIFRCDGRWWLFVETNPLYKFDTLRLYSADELTGPWVEHPSSPVIEGNPHIARPAGRVLVLDDQIIRYTQDCYPVYGTQVRAFEITELSALTYQERPACERPVLTASGRGWNHAGMHHVDAHRLDDGRWLACVDGWVDTTKTQRR